MSLPYKATVFVNWLPVICMPSPESPANRMTARSMTSRLVFGVGGTSVSVDILGRSLRNFDELPSFPQGSAARSKDEAARERTVSQADRREPASQGYHTGSRLESRVLPETFRE